MNNTSIDCRRLSFNYCDRLSTKVLSNISFQIKEKEFVSIVGPSGCGKSTLLKIISGLESNYSGEITIDGLAPTELLKSKKIGFIFQHPALLPWKNVKKNIELAGKIIGQKSNYSDRLIKLFDLNKFSHFLSAQLSGGMKQKVALARALSYNPSLLLMDEPFSSLDEFTRFKLNRELYEIWQKISEIKNIVFVTHSIEESVLLSDKIIVLSGSPAQVKEIVEIKLDHTDLAQTRQSERYFRYVNKIRKFIYENFSNA